MFGRIVNNEIKSTISVVNNQHVITIEGKVEDINNIKCEVQGSLKYSQFYFQIIIDKYIDLKKESEEKQQFNIARIYDDKKEITKNEKCGIYKIKYPIKFVKMNK